MASTGSETAELTAEQIAQRAFDRDLISDAQLQQVWAQLGSRNVPADDLKQLLLRRELLTNFQLDRMIRGERTGYFYGQYKVLYQIGSGTFARVFRAVQNETGYVRAVKVLRKRYSDNAAQREKFRAEGTMGISLRHPNIVPIYEVATEGNQDYLVMEFLEGRNLREFIKIRKKFEPVDAVKILADVTRGLDYATQRGVTHRDLKTSNVLVTTSGQAKLVDFGLAAADGEAEDALAQTDNPRTIDYAALEKATKVRKDDPRTDIYFLGCILYHTLSGQPALAETKDRLQRLSRSRFLDVVPLAKLAPEIPRALVMIVEKAMQLEPRSRYQTPGEMLADLTLLGERMANGTIPELNELVAAGATPGAGQRFKQRSVMIVESNMQIQNVLRDNLKSHGCRVLLTSDVHRPQQVFFEQDKPADCVIFSTGVLGTAALDAFNHFADDPQTQKVPAILLLGSKHLDWVGRANLSEHRSHIAMPVTVKAFKNLIDRLVPPELLEQPPSEPTA